MKMICSMLSMIVTMIVGCTSTAFADVATYNREPEHVVTNGLSKGTYDSSSQTIVIAFAIVLIIIVALAIMFFINRKNKK